MTRSPSTTDLLAARACADTPITVSNPADLTACAAGYAHRAAALTRLSQLLTGSLTGPHWRGTAQHAFSTSITTPRPMLTAAATRYATYAAAITTYTDTATRITPPLRTTQQALRTRLHTLPATSTITATNPNPDPELTRLTTQFQQLHQQLTDALNTCTTTLRRADTSDTVLRDPHGWHHLLHELNGIAHFADPVTALITHPSLANLSHCAATLATALGVLGIGLMVIFPPAGTACLITATVLSAIQTATDTTRRARGEHVPTTTITLDALGAIPILGRATIETREGITAAQKLGPFSKDVTHLVPGIDGDLHGLATHEARTPGHTLDRHVRKSFDYLKRRQIKTGLAVVSSFYNREIAENAISALLAAKHSEVTTWLAGTESLKRLRGRAVEPLGDVLKIGSNVLGVGHGIRVVLIRDAKLPLGYYILTAMVLP